MAGYIVIVTGWRGATHAEHHTLIADALGDIQIQYGTDVLLRHGKCPYGGADLIADRIARNHGWDVEEFPPEVVGGRIQGPARNRAMCAARPRADLVLAFPGPRSRGTWDCLRWAQQYDIPFIGRPLHLPRKDTT